MKVRIHVMVRGKVEKFERDLTGDPEKALRVILDYFEGKVGTVLAVYDVASNSRLETGGAPA